MEKSSKNDKKPASIKVWSDLNRDFDFGNGVCASLTSHKSPKDKKGTTELFYTNRTPKLEIKGQTLSIEYSSTEQDDQELLHFLTGKV
jgi:hypothetical protein